MYNRISDTNKSSKIIDIFPTAVGSYFYDDHLKLKGVLHDMMKNASYQENVNNPGIKHYFDDNDSILLKSNLKNFREWIEKRAYDFATALGYAIKGKMNITDSWLNVSDIGAFQQPHIHTNAFISGTYYVNKTDMHSPLIFKHPKSVQAYTLSQVMHMEYGNTTLYNSDVPIDTREGCLLLWESNIPHGYPPNNSDNRISLSMNLMPSTVSNGRYKFDVIRN